MFVSAAPLYVIWNYTYACNFNCRHCYSRAPKYPSELGASEYAAIAMQIADAGVLKVVFGGGEVLMRRDFLKTLNILSGKGVQSTVTTNGWAVDAPLIQSLKSAGLTELYVSIDSSDPDAHDDMRGRVGSFDRAIRASKLAVLSGIPTNFSSVLTKGSAAHILKISGIANDLGLSGVNFKRFRAAGNGLANKDQLAIPDDSVSEIEASLSLARKRYQRLNLSLNFGAEANEYDSGCSCGITAITIRPNGDISPCSYSEEVIGNLGESTLMDVWSKSPWLLQKRMGKTCSALGEHPLPSNPKRIRMAASQSTELSPGG